MTPPRHSRQTLARPVTVAGVGLHTGARVSATLAPAESPGAGIVFRVASSGGGEQEIAALASNVVDTSRCTVLGVAGARVSTVEHLLSALAGLGTSDVMIGVNGSELPIGDGSARVWTDALAEAGLRTLGENTGPLTLSEAAIVYGPKGAFVAAYPAGETRFTVATQFDHPLAGTQVARWEPGRPDQAFVRHVAPARTFGFVEEIEALRAAGLARGGSLDNALVVYQDRYSSPLRFVDELARHKLLDLVGDLALVGRPVVADVVAVRPSHRLNVELARCLQTLACS